MLIVVEYLIKEDINDRNCPLYPGWKIVFEQEVLLLKQALGDNCLAIHHIGSTSIPDLAAKPIIDIMPVVKNILTVDACYTEMTQIGYKAKGEFGIMFRRYFQKGESVRTHNIHVFEEGNPEFERYLKFRDHLRTYADPRKAYEALKYQLATQHKKDP